MVVIATKRYCDWLGALLWLFYFHELSCRFGVVRVMFGIAKSVTSLWDAGLVGDMFVTCLFC